MLYVILTALVPCGQQHLNSTIHNAIIDAKAIKDNAIEFKYNSLSRNDSTTSQQPSTKNRLSR